MAGGDGGLEDDTLSIAGRYSQLLFSDDVVDDLSADPCSFDFSSSFPTENPTKMLCFGGNYSEECDMGFEDDKKIGVKVTCNDSSSAISTNNSGNSGMSEPLRKSNDKKRNVSAGFGAFDDQIQKNQNSVDAGNGANGNEKLAPARAQGSFKKPKPDNSSDQTCHAKVRENHQVPKVKKEKLGERIIALQQLVSPFGKSDTASVLHEAMGYIRFLHDQVQVLCSPYLQRLPSSAHLHHEGGENGEGEGEEARKDLRSNGLCLVPIELTLHVSDDNGADFWSPATMVNRV